VVRERIAVIRRKYAISPIQVDPDSQQNAARVFDPWVLAPIGPAPEIELAPTLDAAPHLPEAGAPARPNEPAAPSRASADAKSPVNSPRRPPGIVLLVGGLVVAIIAAAAVAGYLLGQDEDVEVAPISEAADSKAADADPSGSKTIAVEGQDAPVGEVVVAARDQRVVASALAGKIAAEQGAAEAMSARKQAAREEAAREEAARKEAAREKAAQKEAAANPPQPPAQHAAPAYGKPVSAAVFNKFKKEVTAAADRCGSAIQERKDQVAHHRELVDRKRYDEAKKFRDEVLSDSTAYSQKIQAAGYSYSDAIQRAVRAGIVGSQLQSLTKIWQARCQ
jgi:hypothetical protein